MHRTSLRIFLSLFFAAGCVKIPTDEARCSLETTPNLENTVQTALENKAFVEGEFPDPHWWEMFRDEQLSHLIYRALANNPTMYRFAAQVRAAEEEAKIKRSRLFPTIGLNAEIDWEYLGKNDFFRAFTPVIPGNITEYELNLDLKYEIDFWGKNRNLYRSAIGLAKAQEAERESVLLMLSTSVAAIYFKIQGSMQQLALLLEERKIITRLFQLTTLRRENALDTASQKLNAEERLFVINKNIEFARQKVELHRHTLKLLLGEGPDAYEEIDTISLKTPLQFPLPQHISCNLLARRPDLMAHIWRVESAAHMVGAAKADFYPRVDLCALAGLDSVFVSKFFRWDSRTASLEPALYLPIFTAGRLKANLGAKRAEFEASIFAYNEMVLRAAKEVADQIVILRTTSETLKIEEQLVQNRIQNRRIMADRYQNAISNLLELLNQQDFVIKQEFEKIKWQYKQQIAAIRLIKALGGGYCTEEIPFG